VEIVAEVDVVVGEVVPGEVGVETEVMTVLDAGVSEVVIEGVEFWPSWGGAPSLKTIEEVLVDWSLFVLEGVRSDRLRSASVGLTESTK